MAVTYPLKAGQFISGWESLTFHLDGGSKIIGAIQDFNWKATQTGNDQVFGSSDDGISIGRKKGKVQVTGGMNILESFFNVLVEKYKAQGLLNSTLQWTINRADSEGAIVPVQLINVTIGEVGQTYKIGDMNACAVTFTAQDIRVNGVSLVGKK